MKNKSLIPSPSAYKIEGSIELKGHNPITTKSPRITEAEAMAIRQKKLNEPGVGKYNISPKERVPQILSSKTPRITSLEEAMYLSKAAPGYVTKNHKLTEERSKSYFMPKPPAKEKDKKAKEIVGPATYNVDDAFKNSQLPSPRFYVSKYKTDNYIS